MVAGGGGRWRGFVGPGRGGRRAGKDRRLREGGRRVWWRPGAAAGAGNGGHLRERGRRGRSAAGPTVRGRPDSSAAGPTVRGRPDSSAAGPTVRGRPDSSAAGPTVRGRPDGPRRARRSAAGQSMRSTPIAAFWLDRGISRMWGACAICHGHGQAPPVAWFAGRVSRPRDLRIATIAAPNVNSAALRAIIVRKSAGSHPHGSAVELFTSRVDNSRVAGGRGGHENLSRDRARLGAPPPDPGGGSRSRAARVPPAPHAGP